MSSLYEHLTYVPYRDLRAIATRLDLRQTVADEKKAWTAAIVDFWHSPELRSYGLSRLSDTTRAALVHLSHVDALPATLFWAEYGTIRRPGGAYPADLTPWLAPQSVSEELYYAGLLHGREFIGKRKHIDRARTVTLPDDLRPYLAKLTHATTELQAESFRLIHDLAQLLVYVHEQGRLRLLHGRWLTPAAVAELTARLLRPQAESHGLSHKQRPWLRFITFLAQATGLLVEGRLTHQAWYWLHAHPTQQLSALWTAWQAAPPELRHAYALSAPSLRQPWWTLLVRCLRQQTETVIPTQFAAQMLGLTAFQDYFTANFDDLYQLEQTVQKLFDEDLSFLSLVQPVSVEAGGTVTSLLTPYRITPLGAWLLHPILQPPPVRPGPAEPVQFEIATQDVDGAEAWHLHLPAVIAPDLQARLAPYATYVPQPRQDRFPIHAYRLDPFSVARAAAQGHSLPTLVETLVALDVTLDVAQQARLAAWHDQGLRLRIQHALLLRTRSADEMASLYNMPAVAPVLGEVLSPTAVLLSVSAQAAAARLAAVDIYATLGFAATAGQDGQPEEMHAANGARWLAGRIYTRLAAFLDLPVPPAALALEELWQQFSDLEKALLERQYEQAEARLLALLDGFVATPPPSPGDPARWRPLLDQAIEAGAEVDLLYFSAGRNLLTRRRVQPYWCETRWGNDYLRGYCHEAGRVLLFRLDRIQTLEAYQDDTPKG